MFDKANNLVRMPRHVVPKPEATDGSYVVAAYGNATHSVTPTEKEDVYKMRSKLCQFFNRHW